MSRGGYRPGAGRKPRPDETRARTLRCSVDAWRRFDAWASAHGLEGKHSAALEQLISQASADPSIADPKQ